MTPKVFAAKAALVIANPQSKLLDQLFGWSLARHRRQTHHEHKILSEDNAGWWLFLIGDNNVSDNPNAGQHQHQPTAAHHHHRQHGGFKSGDHSGGRH
jgi:hypothetical protein